MTSVINYLYINYIAQYLYFLQLEATYILLLCVSSASLIVDLRFT